ncbi:MAG: glycerol acyltransferase, partial [Alistipes sp.]|nr:glycerol acyltransferase [Candidatus Minthomonas equi]
STKGGSSLVRQMVEEFKKRDTLHLCLAPEGTRKAVKKWKTGFHTIARAAGVPVYTGYFDWKTKTVGRGEKIELSDNAQADLKRIRQWYKNKGVVAKNPKNFSLGDELI